MAELVKTKVGFSDVGTVLAFTQATGSDAIVLDNADSRVTLIVTNTNTQNASVTLKAGNGTSAGLGNVAVSVAAGKTVAVPFSRVDSARVKVIEGAGKGQVFVSESVESGGNLANLTLAVLSVE